VRVPIPDGSSEKYRRSLYYERHERRLALMIMAKLQKSDTVLEMGSGRGVLSSLCAKHIGSQRVFTYEANPALISFIEQVYVMNNVKPTIVNAAVGTQSGTAQFHRSERTDSSSLLTLDKASDVIDVDQVDVNELIHEIKPTFLVVDIEGAEGAVLDVADLDGVRIIALEVHKGLLGVDGCKKLDVTITSQGFTLNRWLSTSGRKLYERLKQ